MTAFEPEALGNLVEGIDFHKFYFDNHGEEEVESDWLHFKSGMLRDKVNCTVGM